VNLPDFYFQTLGANSAVPTADRFPSSFILSHKDKMCLIDCGEGAQIKMSEFHVKRKKIDHIFISHLHGDHIFGLPGLVNSFSLRGREKRLSITGPEGIKDYLNHTLEITKSHLPFEIVFRELEGNNANDLGRINDFQVMALPLIHRVPTYGYRFTEVIEGRNIDPKAIAKYEMGIPEIKGAKQGITIHRPGITIDIDEITLPAKKPRSFAYCSDTIYNVDIVPAIRGVDLLYHEATYLHESQLKAQKYMHSTAQEAAEIAKKAGVGKLLIGHYSSRYKRLQLLEEEARSTFENSQVALQGEIHTIDFTSS
jgi:ribonuclease Z